MKFFLSTLILSALVAAQDYGGPPAPAPSSSSSSSAAAPSATSANEHVVTVGAGDQLMFNPSNIMNAKENDTVTFFFMGTFNHSVTQSTFANPCTYATGGFNSGLQPAGQSFSITITNASQPIWAYCEQTNPFGHCGSGMVLAINAPTSGANTFSAFQAKANGIGQNGESSQTQSSALGAATLGAFASAAASKAPASTGGGNTGSGAERITLGAGAIIAGLTAAFYTLA